MSVNGEVTASKINMIMQAWPKNTIATQAWLSSLGISRMLAHWYLKSKWIQRFGFGAYFRYGDEVGWQGGLYALQSQLGLDIHVGGRSSMELQGFAHYVQLSSRRQVLLVSESHKRLPKWFVDHEWCADVRHTRMLLFNRNMHGSITDYNCGNFSIKIACLERAILEEMHRVRTNDDFEETIRLMDGLNIARPEVVQNLLENCNSVKAKRLFLWSSEAAGHAWANNLDISLIDLGKGKRQLYTGGRFNKKYLITVPKVKLMPDV